MRIFYILLVIALALGSTQTDAQNLVATEKIEQLSIPLQTNTVQPLFDVGNNRLYFVCGDISNGDSSRVDQNIYYVDRTKNGWSSIQSDGLEYINDGYNNGVVGISSSGDTLYLIGNYNGKGEKRKGLSMAVRSKEGSFRIIEEIIKIQKFNPLGSFYGFYMHPKGKYLFISMSSRGDHGVDNLYYSEKVSDFVYGEPNRIDALNSDELEFAPYITEDLQTMYFTRSDSTGNFSVYRSNRFMGDSFLNWSTPTIVDELYTRDFEGFFSIYDDKFFFVSDRDTTFTTIYTNVNPELPDVDELLAEDGSNIDSSGITVIEEIAETNDTTEVPELAELNALETAQNTAINADDKKENGSGVNSSPEATAVKLSGVTLAAIGGKEGEHEENDSTLNGNAEDILVAKDTGSNEEYDEEHDSPEASFQKQDLNERSGRNPVTRKYVIDHFEFNVVYAPENELLRVLDSLNQFSELSSISIVGHADMISSDGINIKIGNQRAKTTRWWLTRYGHFDLRLFTIRSLGESEPVKSGEAEVDRAFNRRVEITVTGYLK